MNNSKIDFSFITDENFRKCLDDDYAELLACSADPISPKATHVLAGSLVEALLSDHLIESGMSPSQVMSMSLADVIKESKNKRIIKTTTAELCGAIREYRNLIHPGRQLRTEEVVDANSAAIVVALVALIATEISQQRKSLYGYTAEQLVSKIEQDPTAVTILRHLLADMRSSEVERLLMKVLPRRYFELLALGGDKGILTRLGRCFRECLAAADQQIQQKVAAEYVRVLKEEPETKVKDYELRLFTSSELGLLKEQDASLVLSHILLRFKSEPSSALLYRIKGVQKYLKSDQGRQFVLAVHGGYVTSSDEDLDAEIIKYLRSAFSSMNPSARKSALECLETEIVPNSAGYPNEEEFKSMVVAWKTELNLSSAASQTISQNQGP